ncbi:TIGR04282 family arsenosugar biosynthesis glycosyltransferase [Synechococcus sp. MU1655]|uniref:TIGR04282 family arsenosugar biosynthesis glycosyltransferase n=1 Tax=Synechococcus sp. MU1655 TaxID=2508355 RepID=UPI0020270A69|nr:TIGR04282 family arsenosugar biosynthesis glycosyltransferase [Synechococcus sp. MU1655]
MSQSPIPTLVVMARWPASGRCKRRLAVDIGSERAAIVQQRLTAHTFAIAEALTEQGEVDVQVAMSGVSIRSAQRWLPCLPPCTLVDQGRGSLGARMLRQIQHARIGQPNKPVIVIGTDLADLCKSDLLHAIQRLQNQPLVLGPSADGGYWLLGLGSASTQLQLDALFAAMPWGSDKVLEITCARARELGLTPHQLRMKNDIDCLADLSSWQR